MIQILENRQAKVRFGNTMGNSRTFWQGIPQGSVISPLLFILYINNLAKVLPDKLINTIFADDVGILATRRTQKEAERVAQEVVDVVAAWSTEWKLTLNPTKSEVSIFTRYTH